MKLDERTLAYQMRERKIATAKKLCRVTQSDWREYAGFLKYQRKADNHSALSFDGTMGAQEEGVHETAELHSNS